jgi:hypothetical protein
VYRVGCISLVLTQESARARRSEPPREPSMGLARPAAGPAPDGSDQTFIILYPTRQIQAVAASYSGCSSVILLPPKLQRRNADRILDLGPSVRTLSPRLFFCVIIQNQICTLQMSWPWD